jgi:septal ring-binding cell division protein DamX
VSVVETPPPAPPAEQRTCPRCGAALSAEQEWCLDCGAGVGTTVARPPSWRGPVALVSVLLLIAVAALVLALVELAGDPEQVSEQPVTAPTPTAAPATPAPTTTPPPASTTAPPATGEGNAGGTAQIGEWPAGTEGWTVVLESSSTEDAARQRAQELAEQGMSVGILNSDDYGSLEPGRYVVFSGQYDSRRAADQARSGLSGQVEGAYVRHVADE